LSINSTPFPLAKALLLPCTHISLIWKLRHRSTWIGAALPVCRSLNPEIVNPRPQPVSGGEPVPSHLKALDAPVLVLNITESNPAHMRLACRPKSIRPVIVYVPGGAYTVPVAPAAVA